MVTRTRVTLGLAGLLAGGAGACNWTTFDDLSSEVWVERVNNPDDSRQYGVALGALPDTADTLDGQGANLVVLGRAKLMVSTLRYGGDGKHAVSSVGGQAIFPAFMFDDLPAKPAFAVDPTDHRFAFGSLTGNTLAGQGFIGGSIDEYRSIDEHGRGRMGAAEWGLEDHERPRLEFATLHAVLDGTTGCEGLEIGNQLGHRDTVVRPAGLQPGADCSRLHVGHPVIGVVLDQRRTQATSQG